ncbi:hypothetical protein ABZU30_002770 [Salmonella enterica]
MKHSFRYVHNIITGGVLAFTFSPRTGETCLDLHALLMPLITS